MFTFTPFKINNMLLSGVFEDDSTLLQASSRLSAASSMRETSQASGDAREQDVLDEIKAWEL